MDAIDRRIVEVLQHNADLTNAELADRVNLSPSSCLRRVKRLKQKGVLLKTVALADPDRLGRGLTAIVEVTLERHGAEAQRQFLDLLAKEPAVTQVYSVTGETDVLLVIHLVDMKEYQAICNRLFNHDPNVVKFRTLFAMERIKFETAIPVGEI
ncbi:AsnC family transcriptional regulator [Geothermobacter ehrlichii]|uniref:AsnC family transcriptional regulator n=1 Tax=Geothermobacter ehrlichii TaxID=213224 RepID=A0A5D3WLC2_9BACT|nr:Lrp/AsnC family transcriptional regulator [Geothermobacter ehrlichii]TYO99065.1 AsnC family transcriptional regulator [Geothermobacter ehrlichii]